MLLLQNAFKHPKLGGYERAEKILDTRERKLNDFNGYTILKQIRGEVK